MDLKNLRGIFTLLLFFWQVSTLQATEYPVNNIPDYLSEDAFAVVRNHDVLFKIESAGKATKYYEYTITILNANAADKANLIVPYDQSIKINKIEGSVFNAFGKKIKKFKNKDILDYSNISYFSLYEDNRVKVIKYTPTEFPVTVQYFVEIQYDGLYHYPSFTPLSDLNISVQSASLQIEVPEQLKLRYKSIYANFEFHHKHVENGEIYKWQAKNLKAISDWEPYMPKSNPLIPRIITAPSVFEYEGTSGDLSSWESFGNWVYDLNNNRDNLPEKSILEIQNLTKNQTKREKINTLYQLLQSKTRYVSIQLGIGGFRAFDAKVVDEMGYGDCKALSNYMKAFLKAAGINSYLAIVKAGQNNQLIMEDFPMFQFNHMILCIPLEKDTIWLECTSQKFPTGYLANFTGNRKALIIKKHESQLVNTTSYNAKDNYQFSKINVLLEINGDAKVKTETELGGYQSKEYIYLSEESHQDQKKKLYEKLNFSGIHINDNIIKIGENASIIYELELSLSQYASTSGKRLFFHPNILNRHEFKLPNLAKRNCPIKIDYPYYDVDSVVFHIPSGYHPEYLPENKTIQTEFGNYSISITPKSNREILYVRKLMIKSGIFKPNQYDAFKKYMDTITDLDHSKIILKNTT